MYCRSPTNIKNEGEITMKLKLSIFLMLIFSASYVNALTSPLPPLYHPTSLDFYGTLGEDSGPFNNGDLFSVSIQFDIFEGVRHLSDGFILLSGTASFELQIAESSFSGNNLFIEGGFDIDHGYSLFAGLPASVDLDPIGGPIIGMASNGDLLANFGYTRNMGGRSPYEGTERIRLDFYDGIAFNSLLLVSQPVPIPAAIWLFGSGLLGLFGLSRKKNLK